MASPPAPPLPAPTTVSALEAERVAAGTAVAAAVPRGDIKLDHQPGRVRERRAGSVVDSASLRGAGRAPAAASPSLGESSRSSGTAAGSVPAPQSEPGAAGPASPAEAPARAVHPHSRRAARECRRAEVVQPGSETVPANAAIAPLPAESGSAVSGAAAGVVSAVSTAAQESVTPGTPLSAACRIHRDLGP